MTETTEPRRRGLPPVAWVVLAGLFVGFLLLPLFVPVAPEREERAAAHAMTSVTNTGSEVLAVRMDNGSEWPIHAGQTRWAVTRIIVKLGTCVSVNGRAAVCSTTTQKVIELGLGSYQARRTK